jgi:hypothetical protein
MGAGVAGGGVEGGSLRVGIDGVLLGSVASTTEHVVGK